MNGEVIPINLLSNGLRVLYRRSDDPVEYMGVAIDAGSRDELSGEEGLAHFVEHTIFKGTSRRRAWHILNRMEAVGGELNAYTTKEETMIYSVFPRGHLSRAAELIADLVTGSVFPPAELDKEREVVADEINSYLDTPSESVFDDFEDHAFRGSSLGHNILGTLETVSRFSTADCLRWVKRNYTADRMVLFYMGPQSEARFMAVAERWFGSGIAPMGRSLSRVEPAMTEAFDITKESDTHQSHTVMGCRIPGIYSPLRTPIALLSNILGGPGMNSLLNVELRERRGLVYSVDTSTATFSDAGLLEIYFGCDPSTASRCRRVTERLLHRISSDGIAPRRLDAAKKQYAGQLIVAAQNREQLALSSARSALYNLPVMPLGEIIANMSKISPEVMAECCKLVSPANFSAYTIC